MIRLLVAAAALFFMTTVTTAGQWCAVVIATSDGYVSLRSGPLPTSREVRQLPGGAFLRVGDIEHAQWVAVDAIMAPTATGDLRMRTIIWGYVFRRYVHRVECEPSRMRAPLPPSISSQAAPRTTSPTLPSYQPPPKYDDPYPWPPTAPNVAYQAPRPLTFSHGVARRRSEYGVAPFRITASPGSDYFFKLVRLGTDEDELIGFIEDGRSLETKVPSGTYELRYAAGARWISEKEHFGPDTVYSKADSTLTFSVDGGAARGVEVQLILQRGGNLHTSRIQKSQF